MSKQEINKMREIVHLQAGQCGNQIGAKASILPQQKKNKFFFEVLFSECETGR